jgi:hypothetical protein
MCEVCHYTPCVPRCPNAPDPPEFGKCDRCGEPVFDGDEYYEEPDGDVLCESCADNMTTSDALRYMGCKILTAEASYD